MKGLDDGEGIFIPGGAMKLPVNLVPHRERGLVIALQFWSGDQDRALRLARLIAGIEPRFRNDVTLVLAAANETPLSPAPAIDGVRVAIRETAAYCNTKMRTFGLTVGQISNGYPDGANALWLGAMEWLCEAWRTGDLERQDVFTIEADGCPLARDWIDRIKAEHLETVARGLRVTGPLMLRPEPHINGTLVMTLPWFFNHPSLGVTPPGEAWDIFHRDEIMGAARPSQEIRNIYGATEWSPAQLEPMGKQASWLASTKDNSALTWAEANLTKPPAGCPSCSHVHQGFGICGVEWSPGRTCCCGALGAPGNPTRATLDRELLAALEAADMKPEALPALKRTADKASAVANRCDFEFPTHDDRCADTSGQPHEHWLPNTVIR